MPATLTAIHLYPVKSCRAVAVERAEVARTGLRGDRMFQVVEADGKPVTQRGDPVLATVQPSLTDDGLRVETDGRSPLDVGVPEHNDTSAQSLLGVPVDAADAGDEAADWFTGLLGRPVRLVAMTVGSDYRLPVPGVDMTVSWADAAQVLVVNTASLDWLAAHAETPFGMDRFRPNLTVDGVDAWAEDTWRDFSIGAAHFGLGFAWPRCTIPQVDQTDGTRHAEPAKVLRRHRWCSDAAAAGETLRGLFEGNALFGIGCSIEPMGATVALGDSVTVHETAEPIIPVPG